jgi:hypothetical protein
MTQKSMAYDHPAYTARHTGQFDTQAAGASKSYAKFLAFTAMHVFAIMTTTVTAGTSTYTAWNGTATVTTTGTGDTITAYRLSGTTTTTYGPYANDAAVGGFRRYQISQPGAGSNTADGGIALAAGDLFWVARGTDATAVVVPAFEYAIDPGASLSN